LKNLDGDNAVEEAENANEDTKDQKDERHEALKRGKLWVYLSFDFF